MAETTDPTVAAQLAAETRETDATKRSTAAKKAAATRSANRGAEARKTTASKAKATAARTRTAASKQASEAESAVKSRAERAGEVAEKAVLVPVGAALVARDRLTATIDELRATYSTRKKTEHQLRRFERRGNTALKSIERDAKKTRTRIETQLRDRRSRLQEDVRAVVRDFDFEPVSKNVEHVTARVENVVQSGRTRATKATTTVQEKIASLV